MKKTPLFDIHLKTGARMVPFAGWEMPLSYGSILEEAQAVRKAAGLFDISHMGRVRIFGRGATQLLSHLTSQDTHSLAIGRAHYALILNEQGGIRDDIIVYRLGEQEYLLVVNAINTEKDVAWIREWLPSLASDEEAHVEEITEQTAMLALQGPGAVSLLQAALGNPDLVAIEKFGHISLEQCICCRTGYTGEDGFELIIPQEQAVRLWNLFLANGVQPCGLGARDTLRIEAGFPLYGHEIDENISPVEARLLWAVNLQKERFIGKESVLKIKAEGPKIKLMGLVMADRALPRQGYTIYQGEHVIGKVTSGTFSPHRGTSIAMGYLDANFAKVGLPVEVDIRGRKYPATLTSKQGLLERTSS